MENDNKYTAIALSNTKDACLFFDHVIPLNHKELLEYVATERPERNIFQLVKYFLPPNMVFKECKNEKKLDKKKNILAQIIGIDEDYYQWSQANLNPNLYIFTGGNDPSELMEQYLDIYRKEISIIKRFVNKGIIFTGKGNEEKNSIINKQCKKNYNDLMVKLTKLDLIDTKKIKWEQIIEVRKDKDCLKKIRNFRLFFLDKLADKSPEHIEDIISKEIDDYKETAREHGFALRKKFFSSILSREMLGSLAAGGILKECINFTSLTNKDIIPLLTVSLAFLCKFGLEITEERNEYKSYMRNSPVSYIIKLHEITKE